MAVTTITPSSSVPNAMQEKYECVSQVRYICNDKPLLQRKGPYRWFVYCLLFVVLVAEEALPDD